MLAKRLNAISSRQMCRQEKLPERKHSRMCILVELKNIYPFNNFNSIPSDLVQTKRHDEIIKNIRDGVKTSHMVSVSASSVMKSNQEGASHTETTEQENDAENELPSESVSLRLHGKLRPTEQSTTTSAKLPSLLPTMRTRSSLKEQNS
jgi:hypothetical protein